MDTPKSLTFRIYKGNELLRTETLQGPVIRVGTLPTSQLRLEDAKVARMHAVIEVSPTGASWVDLGSMQGSTVNGRRASQSPLKAGDVVLLGDHRLVVVAAEATTQPQPAAMRMPMAVAAAPPPVPRAVHPMLRPVPNLPQERAVVVTARLGDRVLGEKTLGRPTQGRASGTTIALLIAGALSLVIAGSSFLHGLSVARANKRALALWTAPECVAEGQPSGCRIGGLGQEEIDFRKKRLSPMWDVMAIFGALNGLALLGWALARVSGAKRSPSYVIGKGAGVDFPIAAVPGPFALAFPRSGRFHVQRGDAMTGEITVGGKTEALGAGPVELADDASVIVNVGPNRFAVESVLRPKMRSAGMFGSDMRVWAYLGASVAAHVIFVLLLRMVPSGQQSITHDDDERREQMAHLQLGAKEEPTPEELKIEPEDSREGDGQANTDTGARMLGKNGKMGDKNSTSQNGKYAVKDRGGEWKGMGRIKSESDKDEIIRTANNVGPVRVIRSMNTGRWAALYSQNDYSDGFSDEDVRGGLYGDRIGPSYGGDGFGDRGDGDGGGGHSPDTVGLSNDGRLGHDGKIVGLRIPGGGRIGGRKRGGPDYPPVTIGDPHVSGLDKETVRRYVRRKLNNIQYCYQKQLNVKPGLSGTVNVSFTIGTDGRVVGVRAKGMDADVASCVRGVIGTIQFPATQVRVEVSNYPFSFRPTGR